MAPQFSDAAKALIDGRTFAVIGSIEPDGGPQLSVVWVKRDGDELLISTVEGRKKARNLAADPRCSVLLYPPDAPYTYLEVRGQVTLTRDGARELIDELALKYRGMDRYEGDDGTDNVRVLVRVTPDKIVERGL